MATHRYWRLDLYHTNGGSITSFGFSEIQMRDSVGGSDLTGSGTASASAVFTDNIAANAFDDNDSTRWISPNQNYPAWIKYDFGNGNAYDIVELVIRARGDGYGDESSPRNFVLSYSDDDATYYPACAYIGLTWTDTETKTLNSGSAEYAALVTGAKRYWKFYYAGVGANYRSGAEMELRESVGGADVSGAGTASAMSETEHPASNLFDNNTATLWGTYDDSFYPHDECWVQYDFGSGNNKDIKQITWTNRNDGYLGEEPWGFFILCSDNGSDWGIAWADFDEDNWSAWAGGETRTYTGVYDVTAVDVPTILPVSGAYLASQLISMSCATSGASIYYTDDGSTPDSGDNLYSAPFTLGTAKTIKAIGIKTGLTDSDIATNVYTIATIAPQPIITIMT